MNDNQNLNPPKQLPRIEAATVKMGFEMASKRRTECLLRTLASTKPGGRFLELGTGTGMSAAWILDGMDAQSRLVSVDNDERVVEVAEEHVGPDPRVTFIVDDGSSF